MARFPWRSTSIPALAVLLLTAGCATVPSIRPTANNAPPAPTIAPGTPAAKATAVETALSPRLADGAWIATADLPPVANARMLLTLESVLKSANPGEELDVTVVLSPPAPARAARTTLRVLDSNSTQRAFIGGVTNLPAGTIEMRILPTGGRPDHLAVDRCVLRTVPAAEVPGTMEQLNYPGGSPRAAWRTAAAARIEEQRKAPRAHFRA